MSTKPGLPACGRPSTRATRAVLPRGIRLRVSGRRSSCPKNGAKAVAAFRFSRRAESDLLEIATPSCGWGEDQTIRYIDDLETCCRKLAGNPEIGRACDDI